MDGIDALLVLVDSVCCGKSLDLSTPSDVNKDVTSLNGEPTLLEIIEGLRREGIIGPNQKSCNVLELSDEELMGRLELFDLKNKVAGFLRLVKRKIDSGELKEVTSMPLKARERYFQAAWKSYSKDYEERRAELDKIREGDGSVSSLFEELEEYLSMTELEKMPPKERTEYLRKVMAGHMPQGSQPSNIPQRGR